MTERKATQADAAALWRLVGLSQRSMAELNIDQWQDGYPEYSQIENDTAGGNCCLLTEGDAVVGALTVGFAPEAAYDNPEEGGWSCDKPYVVIHRSMTDPAFRGRGVAGKLFAIAEREAETHGIACVRVDTHPDNIPMRRALEKNGYEYRGKISIHHGTEQALPRVIYEKCLKVKE
ncbi:MAG TPA: GNAT family N-acetyltransferase [Clostridia bacterium]|jgi:RimJ/RimL family protein N-acetyltransferase|nr:GNAT family N-acetyltransferase [Clostridia bacterium]